MVIADGQLSPDGSVRLDADDPGLLSGLGVFETMRTYGGQIFRLDAHLGRLEAGAAHLGAPFAEGLIRAEIDQALAAFQWGEANLRVTLSLSGRRLVRAAPLRAHQGSARCVTVFAEPNAALPAWIKHTSRAAAALAARIEGVTEPLWVDRDGLLLEGANSNVIGVMRGALVTPPLDGRILAGVTREALLEVARGLGLSVVEAPMPADAPFDELYVCSTLRELQPVVELDGRIAPGAGPVGAATRAGFEALVAAETGG